MYYRRYTTCISDGQRAEDRFLTLCEKQGITVKHSTTEENKKHIDFFITMNDKEYAVDVKAMKKITRGDSVSQDLLFWVEIRNNFGFPGWAYSRSPDLIAFELVEGFMLVETCKIRHLIKSKLINEYVSNPREAIYKKYTRKGNKDVLTLVRRDDVPFMTML